MIRIYFRILGAYIRSMLEYEADFWILLVAGVLFQLAGLLFLSAVFEHVPTMNGWTYAECVLIYSSYGVMAALSPLFLEGAWHMPWRINNGGLDYPLVRPAPVITQMIANGFGVHGVGDMLVAGSLLGWSLSKVDVNWTPLTVVIGLILFASAAVIHLSIILITNSTTFWIRGPHNHLAVSMHNLEDMIRFPMSIYSRAVRAMFTVLVPFAFINFLPASWLLGKPMGWIGLLTPVVAIYCVWLARWVFRRGLLRYDSAGH